MVFQSAPVGKSTDNLAKLLLVSLVAFVGLAYVPSLFSDGELWLESAFPVSLLTVAIIYTGGVAFKKFGKKYLNGRQLFDNTLKDIQEKISKLHFGILGGLLGVSGGGIIMQTTAVTLNQWCPLYLLAVCGCSGGLGFVWLTKGSRRQRALIGCAFALLAIMFGLMLSYTAPIIIGHRLSPSGEILSPIYLCNSVSFLQFLSITLFSLNGIFYTYISLLTTYLGSKLFSRQKVSYHKITASRAVMLS